MSVIDPDFDIRIHGGETQHFVFAVCGMRGYRDAMEDRHCSVPELIKTSSDSYTSLLGVFDGHGGDICADFVSQHIHNEIGAEIQRESTNKPIKQVISDPTVLANAFHNTDEAFKQSISNPNKSEGEKLLMDKSGSTGCVSLINVENNVTTITCANAGDSRCVIFDATLIPMSSDHKPFKTKEKQRIQDAFGYIEDSRLNGDLSLSRGFGDFRFKKNANAGPSGQIFIATPDLVTYELNPNGLRFMVIACDGLFDVMDSNQVIGFVTDEIKKVELDHKLTQYDVEEITCNLIDHAVKILDSGDNVTVVLVVFK